MRHQNSLAPAVSMVLSCSILSACNISGPVKPDDLDSRSLISNASELPIQLADGIEHRAEKLQCAFRPHSKFTGPIETGPIWSAVFKGSDGDPRIDLIDTKLSCVDRRSTAFTYSINATLSYKGKTYPIVSKGECSALGAKEKALREAIERAVLDAAVLADNTLRSPRRYE